MSDTSALCFVDGIADGSAGVLAGWRGRPARYFGLRDSSSSNASLVSRTGDEIT